MGIAMVLFDKLTRRNMLIRNGRLTMDDVDLEALADRFGTPLYVYSESHLWRNVRQLHDAFHYEHVPADLFFPLRASSNLAILQAIGRTGIGVEVGSMGELKKALTAGFSGERILLAGADRPPELLSHALERGVRAISTDSLSEIETLSTLGTRMARPADILLEVDPVLSFPNHRPPTPYYLKSGIDRHDLLSFAEQTLNYPGIRIRGLHVQVGTYRWKPETLRRVGEIALELLEQIRSRLGVDGDVLFLGGELPLQVQELDLPSSDEAAAELDQDLLAARTLAELLTQYDRPLRFVLSPGERLIANAGLLLTTVRQVKSKSIRDEEGNITDIVRWLIVDAGLNILPHWPGEPSNRAALSVTRAEQTHDVPFKIGGPLYDHRDYFRDGAQGSEYYLLPGNTRPGDRLAFLDTGAYVLEYMSEANSFPRAGAAMIRTSGQVHLIRHHDTFRQLVDCDVFPGKYRKEPRPHHRVDL
ncbi:MAG: hypothetical protein IMX06_10835 [Kyrpidia tusciae]|nr:hypothetical protein [Kyrpidia tusciae]MBE3553342.1 hypothetical protein [Kyrpidia tusciae]